MNVLEASKKQRWYNMNKFPLVPHLHIYSKDERTTAGFSFDWLFIRIWTIDIPSFEVAFHVDTHWGIGFTFLLIYLRVAICVPCPEYIEDKVYRYLQRKEKPKQG